MGEFGDKPGYAFNPGPPPEVSRYFRNKGIRRSFSWADVEPEEHAVGFSVAKAMQVDVLQTIKQELQKAIDEGVPYAQFAKDLKPKLRRLGWWGAKEQMDPVTGEARKVQLGSPRRLKTIYRANMRSARAAGQWDRIERTKDALPYLVYLLGPSERHRPAHEAKAGMVLPVDDPFWRQWYPPNGWGCKCHVRQITRREAERRGISDSPDVPMRDVLNHRTGEIKRIPSGIDPGWERNPGLVRQRAMEQLLSEKLNAADPQIARVAARDMASSWRVLRVHDGSAKGSVPVAMLPDDLAAALGAKSRVVLYSDYTAAKGRSKHPETTPEVLTRLDDLLHTGRAVRRVGSNALTIYKEYEGHTWLAAVKVTANKDELYLSTFYKAAKRYVTRMLLNAQDVR
ncbi:MAG: phage head morphogenesis protein [Planktomarina sp.]